MKVRRPFTKTRSGEPQLKIGGATIKVDYSELPSRSGFYHNRMSYAITIGKKTYKGDDLYNVSSLQEGFGSLLSFLEASGERYGYEVRSEHEGEISNDILYGPVSQWAYEHLDYISLLRYELEDTGKVFIEE